MSRKIWTSLILVILCLIFFIVKEIRSPDFIGDNLFLLNHFQFSDSVLPVNDKPTNHVRIGIIDGAVNKKHSELKNVSIKQKFFVEQYSDDDVTHATSIAGLTCARDNNLGIRGILQDVEIINAVVLSNSVVDQENLAKAIRYCADESVDAMNISIELYNFSEELISALRYAEQREIKIFMANGNGGWRKSIKRIEKPKLKNLVFVGMLKRSGEIASSNMDNRKPDSYELGDGLISLSGNGYRVCNGTSYACAIATSRYLNNK